MQNLSDLLIDMKGKRTMEPFISSHLSFAICYNKNDRNDNKIAQIFLNLCCIISQSFNLTYVHDLPGKSNIPFDTIDVIDCRNDLKTNAPQFSRIKTVCFDYYFSFVTNLQRTKVTFWHQLVKKKYRSVFNSIQMYNKTDRQWFEIN